MFWNFYVRWELSCTFCIVSLVYVLLSWATVGSPISWSSQSSPPPPIYSTYNIPHPGTTFDPISPDFVLTLTHNHSPFHPVLQSVLFTTHRMVLPKELSGYSSTHQVFKTQVGSGFHMSFWMTQSLCTQTLYKHHSQRETGSFRRQANTSPIVMEFFLVLHLEGKH